MKGIAASSGIAIAKIFKFEQPVLTITKKEKETRVRLFFLYRKT